MSRKRKSLLAAAVVALVAGLLPITLANAAPTKIYDLTVSPTSLAANSSGQSITATFKNATPSGNSSINSLKLFASGPSGFEITNATGNGIEEIQSDGQSVFVSNIPPIKNGKTYVLTMTVTTPALGCDGSDITWTASPGGDSNVWTGSSFSGDTFALNNSSGLTTSIDVSCSMSFTQQPTDAITGAAITPAITVTGTPDSAFDGQDITLSVDSGPSNNLGGTTMIPANSSGAATFSDISLAVPGTYTLKATSGSESVVSDPFFVGSDTIDCGETVTAQNGGNADQQTSVTQTNATGCSSKPYTLTHNGNSVQFLYPTGGTPSAFTVRVFSFAPEPVPSGSIPMTTIDVDASGPLATPRAIKWCNTNGSGPVLPSGEVTCLQSQSVITLATNKIQVTETYYLIGDILYKR